MNRDRLPFVRSALALRRLCLSAAPLFLIAAQAQASVGAEVLDYGAADRLQCLQMPVQAGLPSLQDAAGFIRAELTFTKADEAPAVVWLAPESVPPEVKQAALAQFAVYRLPCLKGPPVRAVQEAQYQPGLGWLWPPVRPVATVAAPQSACLQWPPGMTLPNAPVFSEGFVRVIAETRFDDAHPEAPDATVVLLNSRGDRRIPKWFGQNVRNFVARYRLPCRQPGEPSRSFRTEFSYSVELSQPPEIKLPPLSLAELLNKVPGRKGMRAFFDLDSMSCPFQLRLTHWQPAWPNEVREVDAAASAPNPNRRELMAWLAELDLDSAPHEPLELVGRSRVIEVPCGRLQLSPS